MTHLSWKTTLHTLGMHCERHECWLGSEGPMKRLVLNSIMGGRVYVSSSCDGLRSHLQTKLSSQSWRTCPQHISFQGKHCGFYLFVWSCLMSRDILSICCISCDHSCVFPVCLLWVPQVFPRPKLKSLEHCYNRIQQHWISQLRVIVLYSKVHPDVCI